MSSLSAGLLVIALALNGCGAASTGDSSGANSPRHVSPAERLARLEVHGDNPTPYLVAEAETVLRKLSVACEEDTETIVLNLEASIDVIYSEMGVRESAMDLADATEAAATTFNEHKCVDAMRITAAAEIMSHRR